MLQAIKNPSQEELHAMADKLIIDMHIEFLKRCRQILNKVRDGDLKFLQSFVISMIVRDIWTRNNASFEPEEAKAQTKEELAKLCEGVGLELGNLETFLANVQKSAIL